MRSASSRRTADRVVVRRGSEAAGSRPVSASLAPHPRSCDSMRRVVVTGMGLVTPLGIGLEQVWGRLLAGESGIRAIQSFDVSDLPSRVAAQVPRGDQSSGLFNADDWVPPKDQRRMDQFIVFAMAAAAQAVEDSGWQPEDDEGRERTGVMIGSGIGGLPGITEGALMLAER